MARTAYKRFKKYVRLRIQHYMDFRESNRRRDTYAGLFETIQKFCLFIGYPRSGHSLFGALLDAHPNIAMAHELNAFRLVQLGFDREQILYLILRNTETLAGKGRVTSGYDYKVPNQWQGRHQELLVIGDKKGGGTTRLLMDDPNLVERFAETMQCELRCIHVIRNPFDNIATIARRRRHMQPVNAEDIDWSIDFYFGRVRTNDATKAAGVLDVRDVRHEDIIGHPQRVLADICDFLDLPAPQDYLDDCASIIFDKPNRSRHAIEWTEEQRERVEDGIAASPSLTGYTFDES